MALYASDFSDRHKYLGASELAAAVGLSERTSRYELWCEKTLRTTREHKRIFDRGHAMEPVMLKMLREEHGLFISDEQKEGVNKTIPFLISHYDGIIGEYVPTADSDLSQDPNFPGGPGVLEMKAPGSHRVRKLMNDGLDADYIIQMQANLESADLEWGRFAFLDYDNYDLVCFDVRRDRKMMAKLIPLATAFWKCVEADQFDEDLPVVSLDAPEVGKDVVEVTDGNVYNMVAALADSKNAADAAKSYYDQLRVAVEQKMRENGYKVVSAPGVAKVSMVSRKGSVKLDPAIVQWTGELCGHIVAGRSDMAQQMAKVFLKEPMFEKRTAGSSFLQVKTESEDHNA